MSRRPLNSSNLKKMWNSKKPVSDQVEKKLRTFNQHNFLESPSLNFKGSNMIWLLNLLILLLDEH